MTCDSPGELLTRKEVCYLLKRERTTIWRWEKEGCPFVDGRISFGELLWWLEQRDAARTLGMEPRAFIKLPRRVRTLMLKAAMEARQG